MSLLSRLEHPDPHHEVGQAQNDRQEAAEP
jgi:hypothetical protein